MTTPPRRPPPAVPAPAASSAPAVPSPVPAPPRTATPLARRRAWLEPRVRACWLIAIVLLLIAIGLSSEQLYIRSDEASLIRNGTPIEATIAEADGISIPPTERDRTARVAPASEVVLSYDFAGSPHTVHGTLAGRTELISLPGTVHILIDPNTPERWTARLQPTPLVAALLSGLLVLPLALIAALLAFFTRRSVLQTWQTAPARQMVVVDTRLSALAPLSRAVRCTSLEAWDKRVVTVYLPTRLAAPKRGDTLWIVAPKDRPSRALAAAAFHQDRA